MHRAKEQLDEFIKEKRMEEAAAAKGNSGDVNNDGGEQQTQDRGGKKMKQ